MIQRLCGKNHARRMNAGMTRQPLKSGSIAEQLTVAFFRLNNLPQLGIIQQGGTKCDLSPVWNHPAQHVDISGRDTHYLAKITQYLLGPKGIERNDICDVFTSIAVPYICDHFISSVIGNIRIDIRHGNTVRIQKPFKQ